MAFSITQRALTPAMRQSLSMTAARYAASKSLVPALAASRSIHLAARQPEQNRDLSRGSRTGNAQVGSPRGFQTSASTASPPWAGLGGRAPQTYFQKSTLPVNTVVRFVPQQTAWIVERMGKFNRILQPGLAFLIPFLDRIAYVKSLKESAIEIPSQSAITADNVTLELDGVLYTRVFDAYKAR
jgi:hypothetical protein